MASGGSSGEAISELEPEVDDLATAISQGTVCEKMLERYAQEGRIDLPDQDGKTPLMLACLKQLEDVVLFLLANGANPNSKSLKEGNTPLHYACMVEDVLGKESYYGRLSKQEKWITPKISIVKLLLSHGASVQNNTDGWSPACVAAFYMLKDIVDFFLSMNDDDMPLEDKIKTSEILGVLHSTQDNRCPSKDAFPSLCKAITLKEDAGVPKGQGQASELAAFFSQLSLKEFHTLEEIRLFELSETALKAHAFLVGERLFPPNLKQNYLFPSCLHFAYFLMFDGDDDLEHIERGFQIFSFVLGLERCGELQLGTVLEQLSYAYMFNRISCSVEAQPLLRKRAGDLLCAYVSVINNVHIDRLLDVCHSLIDKFVIILFGDAFNFSSGDEVKSTVQDIEKILRVIRGRIWREKPDEFHKIPSVALGILTRLQKDLRSLCGLGRRWFIVKGRYLLLRILLSDNASYQDRSSGNTLLHVVAHCACIRNEKRCIQDLARAFVRHGCPLDAVNDEGQTARDILQESGYQEKCDVKLVQTLLSPPTTVLQLQEAAARVVLRHKVNYQDVLPLRLRDMVDGFTDADLKISVLKTKNDSNSSEENSDSSDSSAENSDSSYSTEENSNSSEDTE